MLWREQLNISWVSKREEKEEVTWALSPFALVACGPGRMWVSHTTHPSSAPNKWATCRSQEVKRRSRGKQPTAPCVKSPDCPIHLSKPPSPFLWGYLAELTHYTCPVTQVFNPGGPWFNTCVNWRCWKSPESPCIITMKGISLECCLRHSRALQRAETSVSFCNLSCPKGRKHMAVFRLQQWGFVSSLNHWCREGKDLLSLAGHIQQESKSNETHFMVKSLHAGLVDLL